MEGVLKEFSPLCNACSRTSLFIYTITYPNYILRTKIFETRVKLTLPMASALMLVEYV